MTEPSLWIPMEDPIDLAHLGKLAEELAECSAIVARIIIQGMDGVNPDTDVPNVIALENEIADVHAMMTLVLTRFNLDGERMEHRRDVKMEHKQRWHKMIQTEIDRA